MRGKLDDIQIQNVLCSQMVGRIACTDGKIPYIVPVTYTYDGTYIYCQTDEGAKLKILRKNPNVCFEVDIVSNISNWQCVIVSGKFEELKKKDAEDARRILYDNVFTLLTERIVHSHEHAVETTLDDNNRVKNIMYRIRIEKISGRFQKE